MQIEGVATTQPVRENNTETQSQQFAVHHTPETTRERGRETYKFADRDKQTESARKKERETLTDRQTERREFKGVQEREKERERERERVRKLSTPSTYHLIVLVEGFQTCGHQLKVICAHYLPSKDLTIAFNFCDSPHRIGCEQE
jgi:hypothetical protein